MVTVFSGTLTIGGVDYDSTASIPPNAAIDQIGAFTPYNVDPSSGLPWTAAGVDAAEFGVVL